MGRLLTVLLTALVAGAIGFFAADLTKRQASATPPQTPAPTGSAPGVPGSTGPGWGGPAVVEPGSEIAWSPRTLLDSASADVDRDGSLERIELYAAIERDRRGRLAFDDGQRWAVVVRDSAAVYPLFDGFIQLGSIEFWVVDGDSMPPAILLFQRTPHGVLLQKFVFDRQRRAFASQGSLDAVGNVVHQPPAAYR